MVLSGPEVLGILSKSAHLPLDPPSYSAATMEQHYLSIGAYAPDFELPGVDGQVHHLATYFERFKAIGLVFVDHQCPATLQALPEILAMQGASPADFTWIAINASPDNDLTQMQDFATRQGITFPYLRDDTQDVARTIGVSHTPEVCLIDQSWALRYRGQLAIQLPGSPDNTAQPCRRALAQILAGEPIDTPVTPVIGSEIRWRN
jgi:peroxiredoxin